MNQSKSINQERANQTNIKIVYMYQMVRNFRKDNNNQIQID